MLKTGIAQRYARALFQAALDQGAADEVFGDVESFLAARGKTPALGRVFESPQVPTEDKHRLLDTFLKGRVHKVFLDLLHVLIDKKRIMYAGDVAEAYRHFYETHKGILEVKAITAVPLEEAQRARLIRRLEEQTKKTIRLTSVVDAEILGGVILRLEDRLIDGSVRYQLAELKRRLAETKVTLAGERTADA
jgi:F-type H+-transporting ATPase subunit delta